MVGYCAVFLIALRFSVLCVFALLRFLQRDAGAGLLNKETRNAGEKPVHGFMDSLLNPKRVIQSSWRRRSWI